MENEDAPNFSYAYGGAPTSASSWNPALLPDHDEQPAPNAKLGQPSPQIVAQSKPTLESSQNDDEDDEPPALPVTSVVSASFSNGTFDNDPNSDDDFFNQIGSGNSPQEASQPEMSETNGHGVSGVEEDTLVNATQALNMGEQALEPVNGNLNDASGAVQEPSDDQDAEHPAENYEHQGENTFLEEAVIESEKVPLVEDPALAAGDEWGSSGEVFYLGGKSQDLLLETPQAEAAGTTVGDNVIGNTTVGGNAGEDNDWGNTDDQDFFGGGASQTVVPQQSTEEGPGVHVIEDSEINAPTGADPTWDLSLDDDFLPDAEETPVFELDDGEGFLEDEPPQTTQPTSSGANTANRYAPQTAQIQKPIQPAANQYAPQGPQFTNFAQTTQQKPTTTANVAYGGYGQPAAYQQPARPAASSAQSFADKAKGGYHSPYDLPDDVVTTRKRAAPRTATPSMQATPPPPPRSSSIPTSGPPRPLPPSNTSATSLSPPSSSHSATQSQMTGMSKPAAPAKQASSDFFAELPVTTKPKPSGRYTPQQTIQHPPMHHPPPPHHAPPHFPSKERTASWSSLRNEVLPDSGNLVSQLQQPERLPVFPDQPSAPMRANSLPVPQPASAPPPSTRYSPAPPPSAPAASSRYSPAPPSAPAANARYSPTPPQAPQAGTHNRYASEPSTTLPRPPVQPYAPRTSSPLAFHTVPQQQEPTPSAPESHVPHPAVQHAMHSSEGVPRAAFRSPLEGVSEAEEQPPPQQASEVTATARAETPPLRSGPSSAVGSPRKSLNYTPQYQPQQPIPSSVVPPPRSSSQSPSAAMKQPRSFSVSDRSASSHAVMSPPQSSYGVQPTVPSMGIVNSIPSRRQMSHDYECIPPPDERANDPLERWKGYPIFKWGLGGTVVTSFPKQIPRYGGGTSAPVMKISPGEVKIQSAKEVFPMDEETAKFPGPLKGKGKKKDVCAWLGRRIEALEIQLNTPGLEQSMNPDDLKRLEERTLLWKVLQILVDNDGHLEGNPTAEVAVRKVLSIDGGGSADGDAPLSTAADLVTRSRSNTVALQAEPVDARAIDDLRALLTKGDREKAVWHAVDQRLWGHAMLLSSTLSKDVWKQVVQEFVRKEVKKVGRNNQALAMLYEVFAGNHEDCIDELVPASARAGFQMVSTDGAGSEQNALQGLEKWRETLSLVLSNRSEGDATALLSLGKLLAGYGRVEAAHICYIFSHPATYIGGADDAQSDLVLLGADHRQNQLELGIDLEPILLTEVYEFALSLAAPTGSHIIPHLQNYKLAHAYHLAEYGYRTDAQAYCDAITTAMKSTTRISPYYNASFIASLDDLSKRLSQSPKDGSSSWISKPSMDKVSSSLLSKFNSFIAGDDEDAASNHSASGEAGPFAKIAGNSPTTLTPAQSGADLYSAYAGYGVSPAPPSASTNSRYAPSGPYAPKTSMDQPRSRYEPQGRPSMDSNDGSMMGMRATSDSYVPSPQMSGPYSPSLPQLSPGLQRTQAKSHSYSPLRSEQSPAQPAFGNQYEPAPPQVTESAPTFGGYEPPQANSGEPAPPSLTGYEPPTSSYEPPTAAYEPPSYQPYNADADASSPDEATAKPKKKGFMDDDEDDDLAARAAALKSKQKSEADRKADEAFRAAAEADAKRDKDSAAAKKSGGWFGGWFKKDPNAGPGPIKAKLGDENSFVYDPELKKWVNKKAGAAEPTKPMATPPPPRSGPPSRNVSANSMPPSSLPNSNSLSATPAYPPTSNPRSSSMPPPMGIPGSRASTPGIPSDSEGPRPPTLMPPNLPSGPPSRPSTGMSNASSIDDLLGAPQVRKGGASKKKKGGRYVDVMAQGN